MEFVIRKEMEFKDDLSSYLLKRVVKFEFDSLSNAAKLFKAAMLALNLKLEY